MLLFYILLLGQKSHWIICYKCDTLGREASIVEMSICITLKIVGYLNNDVKQRADYQRWIFTSGNYINIVFTHVLSSTNTFIPISTAVIDFCLSEFRHFCLTKIYHRKMSNDPYSFPRMEIFNYGLLFYLKTYTTNGILLKHFVHMIWSCPNYGSQVL